MLDSVKEVFMNAEYPSRARLYSTLSALNCFLFVQRSWKPLLVPDHPHILIRRLPSGVSSFLKVCCFPLSGMEILEKLGFTRGEVRVYTALLEIGESTTGPIVNRARISRSKIYEILHKLAEKGLVSETIKSNTKYFTAHSPKRILTYISEKEAELKSEKESFKELLPKLESLQQEGQEEQEVKAYLGYEGFKTLFHDLDLRCKKKDRYHGFAFPDECYNHTALLRLFSNFHKSRHELGTTTRLLVNVDNPMRKQIASREYYEHHATKYLFPAGVSIMGDCVMIFNFGKIPKAFMIVDKHNAKEFLKQFTAIWESGK